MGHHREAGIHGRRTPSQHRAKLTCEAHEERRQEQGQSLMQYVKQSYNYRSDRVGKALRELTGEEG